MITTLNSKHLLEGICKNKKLQHLQVLAIGRVCKIFDYFSVAKANLFLNKQYLPGIVRTEKLVFFLNCKLIDVNAKWF